jgi:hypothetical protein
MITLVLRQLTYMRESNSIQGIATKTEVPYNALRQILNKGYTDNDSYKNKIELAYGREAYGRLRDIGFSANNARIYSKYRPELASAYESKMMLKIADLTNGAVAERLARDDKPFSQKRVTEIYDIIYKSVRDSIKNSRRTVEEVFDY